MNGMEQSGLQKQLVSIIWLIIKYLRLVLLFVYLLFLQNLKHVLFIARISITYL